jgi:uncharacterized protein YbaR (Trm112 family)
MICPLCKNPIRNSLLGCPMCASKLAVEAVKRAQGEYLRRVIKGEWRLTTARMAGVWHATLFQAPLLTYCKIALPQNGVKRGYWDWEDVEPLVDAPTKALGKLFCNACCMALAPAVRGAIGEPPVPVATADTV